MTVYARIQNQITTVPRYPNGLKIGAYLFPKNDGSSGQALITNGSGTVSWGNAGAQLSGTNTWTGTQTFSKRIVLGTTPTEHVLNPGAALEVNSTGSTTNSGNIAASFIANTDDLGNTSNLLRILLRMLFYLTPIIYGISDIPEKYQILSYFNPMTGIISMYRAGFWQEPNLVSAVIFSTVISLLVFVIGTTFFKKIERSVLKEV